MMLTPSTKSGGFAGAIFWAFGWLSISELGKVARLLRLPKSVDSKPILRWILKHKGITLMCTEIVNYTIHGIRSTTGVVFALGGTFTNVLAIFIVLPTVNQIKGRSWLYGDYR